MKKILLLTVIIISNIFANNITTTNRILNNIKEKFYPDSRTSVFNYTTSDSSGIITINLEIDSKVGLQNLYDSLNTNQIKYNLILSELPAKELNGKIYAVVTLSVVNGRAKPSHPSELVTQVLLGTPVKVLKQSPNQEWYFVQTPDKYLCWIEDESLALMDSIEFKEWAKLPKVIYIPEYGHCYEKSTTKSDYVSDLVAGNILSEIGNEKNFVKVKFPDGREAFIKKEEVTTLDNWLKSLNLTAENLIKTGKRFLGQPYLWGGTSSKALDCSGFVKTCFYLNGVILQRDASQQVLYGEQVDNLNDISKDFINLKPGDLLFWGNKKTNRITHVGLYIGNGQYIHSSGKVKINSFNPKDKNHIARLIKSFITSKRYLGHIGAEGIEKIQENWLYKYYFVK